MSIASLQHFLLMLVKVRSIVNQYYLKKKFNTCRNASADIPEQKYYLLYFLI